MFDRLSELRSRYDAQTLLILGDVTDRKDNHSAVLLNRIVENLGEMVKAGFEDVIILQGNHDYLNKEAPYLQFLNWLQHVTFIYKPKRIGPWVFIPHSRTLPLPGLDLVREDTTHCFMHQTVDGAIASNGQEMEGEIPQNLPHADTCKYYSGDIHVPQICGHVDYVGSPHPVHFGDTFRPRILVLHDRERETEHYYKGPRRHQLAASHPDQLYSGMHSVKAGDQVKVRLRLSHADQMDWQAHKAAVTKWAKDADVKLVSVELVRPQTRAQLVGETTRVVDGPQQVLTRYANKRSLDDETFELGEQLLKDAR